MKIQIIRLELLMSKNKTGRPTVITDEVVGKLEDAIKHGASITEACNVSGISRDTFYEHCRSDQKFSDKMERARSCLALAAKRNIAISIMSGNIKTSIWLLDKKDTVPACSIISEVPTIEQTNLKMEQFQAFIERCNQRYRHELELEYDLVPKV